MVSYYSSPRKPAMWLKKVLFHLLILNYTKFIFYSQNNFKNTNLSYKLFRDQIIEKLIRLPIQTTVKKLFKLKKTKKKVRSYR